MNNTAKRVLMLVQAAAIAALYVVLSLPVLTYSFGPVQIRLSEALTVLPFFSTAAVPGLFVGCLLTNIIGVATGLSTGIDIIVGSLATLLAAWLSRKLRHNKCLVPLPPVLVNAVAIGVMLSFTFLSTFPIYLNILYVGIGQLVTCYGLGIPLLLLLERSKIFERMERLGS